MKKNSINKKFKVVGLTETNEIIKQETLTVTEHDVQEQYLLLAKNNFNRYGDPVICPGYFNKKTNFIIGEVLSIMSVDINLNQVTKNTSELFKDNKDFILYPIPCLSMEQNKLLEYVDKASGAVIDVELTFELGKQFGAYLSGIISEDEFIECNPNYSGFFRLFVDTRRGVSFNKNVLLNSNPDFVLGILNGYHETNGDKAIFINNNVNIYTFAVILNYLGASYSIRNAKDNRKKVFIQLPRIFEGSMPSLFMQPKSYKFNYDTKELYLSSDELDNVLDVSNSLDKHINNGSIIAIPISAFTYEKVQGNRMYDLTSERHDATNYAMSMTPILKNSDGDILAASGIFTKEGLEDAKVFSPESKEYYKNLNDGNIDQWIADDAIVGLYNATSHISKK